jgi:hypothetical protein
VAQVTREQYESAQATIRQFEADARAEFEQKLRALPDEYAKVPGAKKLVNSVRQAAGMYKVPDWPDRMRATIAAMQKTKPAVVEAA